MAAIDRYKIKIDVEGQQAVDNLKNSLGGLGTIITGISITAFAGSILRLADAMSDLANATGLAIKDIATFDMAIMQAGGKSEDASKMLATFYQQIDKAASGSEEAQKSLEKVGITLNDLANLSEKDLLKKAVSNLAEMAPGAERTAAGMDVLGKAFRNLDPKALQQILEQGTEIDANAIEKMAQAADSLAYNLKQLQLAGATVFSDIMSSLEPFIGKLEEGRLSLQQAEKIIKAVGIALGIAFAAKTVAAIGSLVTIVKSLNTALKANAAIQAGIQALQGPKGWAMLAGAAVAAGAAIYGLNKLLEENDDKTQEAVSSAKELNDIPGPKRKVQLLSDKELDAQRTAIAQAKEQTRALERQNTAALKYKQIIIDTIGLTQAERDVIITNAQLEQDASEKIADLQSKIDLEKQKGRTTNQGLITEYQKQQQIIRNQVEETKKLNDEERNRINNLKEIGALIDYTFQFNNLENERKFNTDRIKLINLYGNELTLATSKLDAQYQAQQKINDLLNKSRGLVDQKDLDKQNLIIQLLQDYADESKQLQLDIATGKQEDMDMTQRQIDLNNQLIALVGQGQKAELANIINAIDLENRRSAMRIQNTNLAIEAEKKLQQNQQEGALRALADIEKQFTPYKMAQDAVAAGWSKIGSAVDEFVRTGKFSFSDFAKSVLRDLTAMILKAQIFSAIKNTLGFFGFTLPGLAEGGPAKSGQPYIVGERGPELFVPKQPGTVIPNNKLGIATSSNMNAGMVSAPITNNYITNNISALDAKSVAQLFAENRKTLLGTVRMAEKELPYGNR